MRADWRARAAGAAPHSSKERFVNGTAKLSLRNRLKMMGKHVMPKFMILLWTLREKELGAKNRAGLAGRLRHWRKGYFSDSHIPPLTNAHGPEGYLNDYRRLFRAAFLNENLSERFQMDKFYRFSVDKYLFTRAVQCISDSRARFRLFPRIYGAYFDNAFYPMDDEHPVRSAGELAELIRREGRLILKPVYGEAGQGILFAESRGGEIFINGKAAEFEARAAGYMGGTQPYFFEEYVRQASYSERIFPHAVNTIRVVTMWDMERHEPFVAFAAHRFGRDPSKPVDNFSQGGVSSLADPESGILGPCAYFESSNLSRSPNHPLTGEPIEGVRVPGWEAMKNHLLFLASRLPFLPYLGWDAVAGENGFFVLEVNNRPGVAVYQAHGPLLRDPRVRAFYRHHGVI